MPQDSLSLRSVPALKVTTARLPRATTACLPSRAMVLLPMVLLPMVLPPMVLPPHILQPKPLPQKDGTRQLNSTLHLTKSSLPPDWMLLYSLGLALINSSTSSLLRFLATRLPSVLILIVMATFQREQPLLSGSLRVVCATKLLQKISRSSIL